MLAPDSRMRSRFERWQKNVACEYTVHAASSRWIRSELCFPKMPLSFFDLMKPYYNSDFLVCSVPFRLLECPRSLRHSRRIAFWRKTTSRFVNARPFEKLYLGLLSADAMPLTGKLIPIENCEQY